jgi:hypothetical protein
MLKYVYRDEDAGHYVDVAKSAVANGQTRERIAKLVEDGRTGTKAEGYFKQYFRRHQLSDHKLLWCEIKTDYADQYLDAVIAEVPA